MNSIHEEESKFEANTNKNSAKDSLSTSKPTINVSRKELNA